MLAFLIFITGLAIGSFLNVCIVRIPNKESVLWGRSKCPYCGHAIAWYDNIPLLSFIFLRGKCRYCGQKISFQYPLIELFTALITLALFQKFGLSLTFLFYAIFSYFLIVLGMIDLKTHLLLNRLLLPLLIIGIILNLFAKVLPLKDAAIGAFIGGVSMWLVAIIGSRIFQKEALGMGDVKLSFVAGFYLGWKHILLALYFGFIMAFIFIAIIWIFKRKNFPRLIPMGPFFTLGFIVYLFYGQKIVQWYIEFIS